MKLIELGRTSCPLLRPSPTFTFNGSIQQHCSYSLPYMLWLPCELHLEQSPYIDPMPSHWLVHEISAYA